MLTASFGVKLPTGSRPNWATFRIPGESASAWWIRAGQAPSSTDRSRSSRTTRYLTPIRASSSVSPAEPAPAASCWSIVSSSRSLPGEPMMDRFRSAQSALVSGCSTSSSGLPHRYWPNGAPGTTSTAWCPARWLSQLAALRQ